MTIHRCWPLAGLLLAVSPITQASADFSDLPVALAQGTAHLDLRLRDEYVDRDAAATPDTSDALTLRARLAYSSAVWRGVDASIEYEGVTAWDQGRYNSGVNGITSRPVIADPTGSELNQAWLRYRGLPWTTITLGRQRYTLDNQRFVGNVGWRQNEQTYDGVSAVLKPVSTLSINYAYFHNIDTPQFLNVSMKRTHLLNAAYRYSDALQLGAYGYWLDFEHTASAANRQDSRTLGLRGSGSWPLQAGWTARYGVEYAQQRGYADAASAAAADYWSAELGVSNAVLQARLGSETLGSHKGQYGFQTPLATLHAFNGWADQFLVTPDAGLRDRYASVALTQWRTTATLVYHRFDARQGGAHDGDEWDASVSRPIGASFCVLAKYAYYDADRFSANTRKLWLQTEYRF